ncbi:Domain of uncharacterised function (DUF1983) [Serratia fonticola]|uniref:Domain of uncharacterized function (DUF1983) n=1 Tax=Serratia fonticola TaxID=47917 RepID=A0A4U9VH32_SERFO|nr:Domain of uncharacterised function (DUF1983) [Serratia fonticola]
MGVDDAVNRQFLVRADRFALVTKDEGNVSVPFAVQNGQTFINSAFIADGTITNAKIGNAAITTAKIGDAQIDTLRIKGNSVIVPAAFEWQGGAYANDTEYTLIDGVVSLDYGAQLIMVAALRQSYFNTERHTRATLYLNGNQVAEFYAGAPNDSPVMMATTYAGAGVHRFTIKWWAWKDVVLNKVTLAVWGAMR